MLGPRANAPSDYRVQGRGYRTYRPISPGLEIMYPEYASEWHNTHKWYTTTILGCTLSTTISMRINRESPSAWGNEFTGGLRGSGYDDVGVTTLAIVADCCTATGRVPRFMHLDLTSSCRRASPGYMNALAQQTICAFYVTRKRQDVFPQLQSKNARTHSSCCSTWRDW